MSNPRYRPNNRTSRGNSTRNPGRSRTRVYNPDTGALPNRSGYGYTSPVTDEDRARANAGIYHGGQRRDSDDSKGWDGQITYADNGMPIMPPRPWHMYIPIVAQAYNDLYARWQTEYNQWQLEQERHYNSPENQRELLEQAGMNPNLAYSQGSAISPGTAEGAVPQDRIGADAGNIIQTVMAVATGIANIKKINAETAVTLTKADLEEFLLPYKKAQEGVNTSTLQDVQITKTEAETRRLNLDSQYKVYENKLAEAGLFRQDPIQWRLLHQVLINTGMDPVDVVNDIIKSFKTNMKDNKVEYHKGEYKP